MISPIIFFQEDKGKSFSTWADTSHSVYNQFKNLKISKLWNRLKEMFILSSVFLIQCKIYTYQPRKGTVPQVQGYRPESFGIRSNAVGDERLIDESALT